MTRRTLMLALPALVAVTAGAYAYGGWAVVTIDDVPTQLTVGKPTTYTFVIRQHGVTLMNDVKPTLEAKSGPMVGGTTVNVAATRTNADGQYTASLTVPKPGEWRVTVNSGWGNSHIKLYPIQAVEAGKTVAALPAAERGRHLFAAKGCTTCHVNKEVEGGLQMDVGPDLTGKTYDPAYLALWLANPAIRPPTDPKRGPMPNLGLSKTEIASLTAFITNGKAAAAIKQ
jgi:mono/diheme cytochrome c family protein